MKKTLSLFLFVAFAATISAQTDATIDKGSGWLYFTGIPGTTPSITAGSEVAINTQTREAYVWNRDSSEWQKWLLVDSMTYAGDTLRLYQNGSATPLSVAIAVGGIYGGSGTVPASTWAELLGSLIFDIDSLGSFTVGDIDEKNTGAKISISNAAGNDGQITIKSGSGAGYTDATVEVNNYSLPGNKPNSLSLAAGDYLWLVSEAGVRKGQDSTGWIHIDSLLAGYTTGTGTSGTLPIWTGSYSLGNSSITESGGTVVGTSFTGAFGLAVGTDAQQPVGANGRIRYSTTGDGVQAWNGTTSAYTYLPWATADNFTSGSVLFANANGHVTEDNSGLFYDSGTDELRIGGNTDRGNYDLQLNGQGIYVESAYPALYINQGRIEFANNQTVLIDANPTNFIGYFLDVNHTSTNASSGGIKILSYNNAATITVPTGASSSAVPLLVGMNRTNYTTPQEAIRIGNEETLNVDPNTGSTCQLGGALDIRWRYKVDNGASDYRYTAAAISPEVIDYVVNNQDVRLNFKTSINNVLTTVLGLDSLGMLAPTYGTGTKTGTHSYSASFSSSGRIIEVPEKWGDISTSTDGSGDIVVAHGMGVTPTSVQVTVTGTTPYVVTVHTIGSTNFTVRFYDMTGAAVTSTAVTATWHCKT